MSCQNDTLELSIPIELVVELTEPYSNSRSTQATFSATVILDEESVAALIEAGNTLVDIASASVTTNVTGATPTQMTASLSGVPFRVDLQSDTDDNGMPGPHRLELEPVNSPSNADPAAREVVFGLRTVGISLLLGNFNIPMNCFNPSLFGAALEFPVHL